jgi:hydroxyethylthiazole kinase-like uncharacterized protein yjeF
VANSEGTVKIVTVDEMRRIEAASDAVGHSYAAMMEQAGQAVAQAIIGRRQVQDRQILVLVGPGNNGGDGLVAARYLSEAGTRVTCYLLKPRDPAQDENFNLVQQQKVEIVLADQDGELTRLQHLSSKADVIVNALLGTGARLPLRGRLAEMLGVVKRTLTSRRQSRSGSLTPLIPAAVPDERDWPVVVAVDGPSGLDHDNGALDEVAVPADLTVTFAYPKPGHFCFPGDQHLDPPPRRDGTADGAYDRRGTSRPDSSGTIAGCRMGTRNCPQGGTYGDRRTRWTNSHHPFRQPRSGHSRHRRRVGGNDHGPTSAGSECFRGSHSRSLSARAGWRVSTAKVRNGRNGCW